MVENMLSYDKKKKKDDLIAWAIFFLMPFATVIIGIIFRLALKYNKVELLLKRIFIRSKK